MGSRNTTQQVSDFFSLGDNSATVLSDITRHSRMSITNDIEQAINNLDWGSVLETILASARDQAAEGKAFVKIKLTPEQAIGDLPCVEDDRYWTSGGAYRKAYEKRLEDIINELGFDFHRNDSIKEWREGNTWMLTCTVSWESMVDEDVKYYEEDCEEDCEEGGDDEDYEEEEEEEECDDY